MYKIQFIFNELPFDPYYKFDEKLISSIQRKVNSTEITLPIIPTKEMSIDLSTFNSQFGFTDKEMEAINDCNQFYCIDDIIVTSSNIVIWLIYDRGDGY